jgi:hypothetical protein
MRNRIFAFMRPGFPVAVAALAAFAAVAASGCLVGTLPVPAPNDVNPSIPQANASARETFVMQQLQLITRGEGIYAMNNGKYATIEELIAAGQLTRKPDGLNYNITLTLAPDAQSYTVSATPQAYGPDGQRSFFVDETGVIRGANHGGSPASAADPPAQDFTGR